MIGLDDRETYDPSPPGRTWKQVMLEEVGERLDMSRVRFIGSIPYQVLIWVFSASWAHVYLTYPFVLSWSLLDAMACGALVVGSDTAPVRELIEHGRNGLLVDFFDVEGLVQTIADACWRRDYHAVRAAARH